MNFSVILMTLTLINCLYSLYNLSFTYEVFLYQILVTKYRPLETAQLGLQIRNTRLTQHVVRRIKLLPCIQLLGLV